MCFTVNVNLIKEELQNRYGATLIDPDKYRPSYYYQAFGFPDLPVICSDSTDKIRLLKWGLIPSWIRSMDHANEIRLKTFNARSDSVDNKQSFSSSFKNRRCIIPVKGFFEWQHSGKEKTPWYIYSSENEIITLAGLYDEWIESSSGNKLITFSIVTTDANELMAEIHNSGKRMPALLETGSEEKWLDISVTGNDALKLLKPAGKDILKAHTVSPLINDRSKNRNVPEVILPYHYSQQKLLF
jgi:putative SOS response-associated peptidase YedK